MKKLISVFSLSALLLVSCSKSSDTTSGNNNNNTTTGANQVVVNIGGTTITFKTVVGKGGSYTTYPGIGNVLSFGIAGADSASGKAFGIGGGGDVGNGTYDVGVTTTSLPITDFGMSYDTKDSSGNKISYGTDGTKKVGTITISSVSTAGAQGKFTATLPQKNGGSGSVSVDGSFNVTFQ